MPGVPGSLCHDCCNCCLCFLLGNFSFIKIVIFLQGYFHHKYIVDRYACRCFQSQWVDFWFTSDFLISFYFDSMLCHIFRFNIKGITELLICLLFQDSDFFSFKFRTKRNGIKSVYSIRWKFYSWFNFSICVFQLQVPDSVPTKINGNLSMESNIFGFNFKTKVFSNQL